MCEDNWTGAEDERQDCVDSIIQNALEELARGAEVEWDMENIADIRDAFEAVIVDRLNLMTSYDFYPYRELTPEPDENGNITLEPSGFIISDQFGKITHLLESSIGALDAQEYGDLIGELFGGTCRYIEGYKYRFIPNSDYQGGLDDIKED